MVSNRDHESFGSTGGRVFVRILRNPSFTDSTMISTHSHQPWAQERHIDDETYLEPLLKIEDLSLGTLCRALVISPDWPEFGSEHAIG